MLDGANPFDSSSDFGTRENIVKHPPKPLSNAESIPRDLRIILQRCLQKNTVDRYPSAVLLADDLKTFLGGRPVAGIQPSAWKQSLEIIRQHPIASSITLTGLLTVLISGLLFIYLLNREWQTQKKIADDGQEAFEMFLSSVTTSNGNINDVVISGQRVPPDAFLTGVLKQISLVEKAFAKNPNNKQIAINLEVMDHYASLLFKILSGNSLPPESQCLQDESIHRRLRSLEIIDELLADGTNLDPESYQKRLKDRIVGEHWMGLTYHFDEKDQKENKKLWLNRSVEHVQEYLATNPNDKDMTSILNANRKHLGTILLEEDPSEALKNFEDAYRYFDGLRDNGQLDMDPASHALNAIFEISKISIRSSDPAEKVEASIERCVTFCNEHVLGKSTEDWKYRDLWIGWLSELSMELYQSHRWDLLDKYAIRWREYSESINDWQGAEKGAGIRQNRESNIAAAAVYQLTALKRLKRADEYQRILKVFSQTWEQCTADPSFDPKSFWGMLENKYKVSPDDFPITVDSKAN